MSTGTIQPDREGGGFLSVLHCGCYYEADSSAVESQFFRDAHLWGYA